MLHGGRFGNVQDVVAHFTSSKQSITRFTEVVLTINKAPIAIGMDQNMIQWQSGTKIIAKDTVDRLELTVKLGDMAKCASFYKVTVEETCKVQDRSSHIEVKRALKERLKSLMEAEKAVLNLKTALSTASNTLNTLVGFCSSQ
ncbi:MAG: hypothetical protein FWD52_06845 [Candidatus Bathyarchaeota archaeon]|nr:hypothetical protein [Candidatus Termiticorpusculum sp.]